MGPCDVDDLVFLQYLGSELHGQELKDFRQHLRNCAGCRTRLAEEQALSILLRRSRPLYSVPPALRARILAMLAAYFPARTEGYLRGKQDITTRTQNPKGGVAVCRRK